MYDRWWISPKGAIIKVKEASHINEVIKHPEKFGVTRKEINAVYARYDEPLGLEGKARKEIMRNLMMRGWTRVRYDPNRGLYLETALDGNGNKDIIYSAINYLLKENYVHSHDPVTIVDIRTLDVYKSDNIPELLKTTNAHQIIEMKITSF